MSELLEDWQKETRDRAVHPPNRVRSPDEEESFTLVSDPERLETFGACMVCAAPRSLHMEPVGGGTSRLMLVCDACGTRTEI